VRDDIINRLQCRHPVGPIINGEPEFGWRDFSGFAEFGMVLPSKVMLDAADEIATLRAQLAAAEARAERLAGALRALLESDKDGAIAAASDEDLLAAISDETADDVVRIQAAAVFAARAALAEGDAG